MDKFCCLECGKRFKTVAAARRAANNGCPGCGGVDIDLDTRDDMYGDDARPLPPQTRDPLRERFGTE